jgi:hypothetical protein
VGGLLVIDVSDPVTPTLAGSYDTPGPVMKTYVDGEHAFIANYSDGLGVFRVFTREFDADRNVARSLIVDASHDWIFGARLTTTQTQNIDWEVSADGGWNWQDIEPDGKWTHLTNRGNNLIWRSTHMPTIPGVNPSVTQLDLEWIFGPPAIDSIVDMPEDQGGWVRVNFTRSGRDFAEEVSFPTVDYGIWRRIDTAALVADVGAASEAAPADRASNDENAFGVIPIIAVQGRSFVRTGPDAAAAADFPPGTWEWVGSVQALQQHAYIAAIPTTADSSASGTNNTVLVITEHSTTPSVWYISVPDSGYSLDNIAPAVPANFAVAYNTGSGNALSWDPCPDDDFQYFRVYRSTDPGFTPSPATQVHSTTATGWNDPEYDGWPVYYKVTALDDADNESDPASAGTATGISEPVIPQVYTLYQNVPNPFNPSTVIRYDVPPGGGVVSLRIYDVGGRLVRTLVDGPESAGQKSAVWYGTDGNGSSVSSGIYFYRLDTPEGSFTNKMLLMK